MYQKRSFHPTHGPEVTIYDPLFPQDYVAVILEFLAEAVSMAPPQPEAPRIISADSSYSRDEGLLRRAPGG